MKQTSFLIVDDNSITIQELRDTLKYLGYREIHTTGTASEAWAMLKIKAFDCIFAAWDMPEMTGLALLKIIRNDDRFVDLPFFLMDAALTKAKVIEAGSAGVSGLVVTPFEVDTIKKKVAELAQIAGLEAPSEEQVSLEKGIALLEGGDYQEALSVFERMLQEGESAEVYYNIGYIKTSQGLYQEGIEAFRRATQLDRLFARAYEAMGRAYKELGKPDKAEECLHQAAQIYMSSEKDEHAEEILNEILELQPDTVNVYNSLGVLYRKRGDLATALQHYQKALKIHPDAPHIFYNIGRVHIDMGKPDKAESCFRHALKLQPDFKEAREALDAVELGRV
ncbi:MAG: tetratricopeptide repeat protein [Deltaproteobacteria bacterium]|nr:tetratricopeptide repeat protein [Deltaproteobacteria bacterium]